MSLKSHINNDYDSYPTAFFDAVGGITQKWKNLKNVSQKHIKHTIPKLVGEEMGELVYALKNCKRSGFPIYLDPKTSSFIEVALHAKIRQYLSDNTIIKNIRYARFMETHSRPVVFRDLKPEQVLRHFDYRIEFENATGHALAHEKKTVLMFLRAYGVNENELKMWS